MGWARIRDLEKFAFIALGACFSIGISFHLTEWEGTMRAKFGGGFLLTLTESWILVLLAGLAGAILAALVGIATLRIAGVYFVIFTLGMAELVR